ncbi:MAG: efflux transporter outer membrane subunit [Planctomycetota bacterium]
MKPVVCRLLHLLGVLLVAGCAVGPDYEAPQHTPAPQWREAGTESGLPPAEPELERWWCRLGDPVLEALIERATGSNLDLREALARVQEARALRGVAAADQWPSLDAVLSYKRMLTSETTAFGRFGALGDHDLWAAGFDASWELDVWGRVRRGVEAAQGVLEGSIEDARAVYVTMTAEIAVTYVTLRSFQRRLEIARTNVALQEATLALVQSRFDAGIVSERDLAQAAASVDSIRARVPEFEAGLRQAENRLAVLLGLSPGELAGELAEVRVIPVPPIEIAVGVPADLLRRRADVRRAEQHLISENARIGAAQGDLYPRVTLLGNLGFESDGAARLFEHTSSVYGIGPQIRWNLFDAGRIRQRVHAQSARAEQALTQWRRTVLTALEEAENAMTTFLRERARRASLLAANGHARRAVELAQTQYSEGLSDFQAVLDSQRTLADLDDQLAQSEAAVATNAVTLYKALGGGWEPSAVAIANGERDGAIREN